MRQKGNEGRGTSRWLLKAATVLFVFSALCVGAAVGYSAAYSGRIFPGVRIAGIPLGGIEMADAEKIISQMVRQYEERGVEIKGQGASFVLFPAVPSLQEPDAPYELVHIDIAQTLSRLQNIGREGSWIDRVVSQWRVRFQGEEAAFAVSVRQAEIVDLLQNNFSGTLPGAQNANIEYRSGAWNIVPERAGKRYDFGTALSIIKQQAERLDSSPIVVPVVTELPALVQREVASLLPAMQKAKQKGPLAVRAGDNEWIVEKEDLLAWWRAQKKGGKAAPAIDRKKVFSFLRSVKEEFDTPAQDAKFALEGNRVVEFQESKYGRVIDEEESFRVIERALLEGEEGMVEVALVVRTVAPQYETGDINDLGIAELIGRGESYFAGSSQNRIHNIRTGIEKLDGILIPPGEEFSLVAALGDIDAQNGYVQEMVIKGDRTVPEYGGGLCQVGTTVFRAALDSGLPITERRNHSYIVRYYEPIGTDATIYGPHPDLRFVNDTGNYILVRGILEGTTAVFEFWGTRDGRIVSQTKPKVYNFVSPPPPKIIETDELPPGEKKCTEKARQGATAEFTYMVEYPDGEVKEKVFKSYYRPWQEVCLIGKGRNAGGNKAVSAPF